MKIKKNNKDRLLTVYMAELDLISYNPLCLLQRPPEPDQEGSLSTTGRSPETKKEEILLI